MTIKSNFYDITDTLHGSIYTRPIIATSSSDKGFYDNDMLDYLLKDIIKEKAKDAEKELQAEINRKNKIKIDNFKNSIKNVIYNKPATIVLWKDGTKTVVKCQPGDTYDREKGLAMCIIKRLFNDSAYFNSIFEKWLS